MRAIHMHSVGHTTSLVCISILKVILNNTMSYYYHYTLDNTSVMQGMYGVG